MKQTVRTKNYDAVLEIPYHKLTSKCNFYKVPQTDTDLCTCTNRVTVSGSCCCTVSETKVKTVNVEILEELQNAYDLDMAEKEKQISLLRMESDEKKDKIKQLVATIAKLEGNLGEKDKQYGAKIKEIEDNWRKAEEQVRGSKLQRQKIIRSKISEFQSKLTYELIEQEKHMNQLKQKLASQYFEKQKELLRNIQTLNLNILTKTQQVIQKNKAIQNLRQNITKLNMQANEDQNKIRERQLITKNLQNQIQSLKEKNYELNNTVSELRRQLSTVQATLNAQQQSNQNLSCTVSNLYSEKAKIEAKLYSSENQLKLAQKLRDQYKIELQVLKQKKQRYQNELHEKERLVRHVDSLQFQIQLLRKTFTENGIVDERIRKVQQEAEESFRESESKIREECQLHETKISELEKKNQILEQSLKELRQENENFLLNLGNLEGKIKELENSVCHWKCRYLSNEKQFTELEHERNNLLRRKEENQNKIERMQLKIHDCEQEKIILVGKLNSYEKDVRNMNSQIHHIRNQLRKLHITLAEKQKLLLERQSCSHEVNIECQKYISSLERQVEEENSKNKNTTISIQRQQRSNSYSPHKVPVIEHQQGMTSENIQQQLGQFYRKELSSPQTFGNSSSQQ